MGDKILLKDNMCEFERQLSNYGLTLSELNKDSNQLLNSRPIGFSGAICYSIHFNTITVRYIDEYNNMCEKFGYIPKGQYSYVDELLSGDYLAIPMEDIFGTDFVNLFEIK